MNIKKTLILTLSYILVTASWNRATAQVYLEKRSNGHANISSWYKVGRFKIVLGPCLGAGRDQENIDIHVPMVKQEYSYQDLWIKNSPSPIKLCKGTIKLDTIKRKIIIDLYEEKDGKATPLAINGKHKLIIYELKAFRDGELFPDQCVFNK
jgi:hypothetical protein